MVDSLALEYLHLQHPRAGDNKYTSQSSQISH